MKALILAAGRGTRLGEYTRCTPKTLVTVNGQTILERMLTSLMENGIGDIIIVTGYLPHLIEEYVAAHKKFKTLSFTYINNSCYNSTNYIYSIYLAKKAITEDSIVLLHGDVIFHPKLLANLLKHDKSIVPVNKTIPPVYKDFIARVTHNRIREIGLKLSGSNIHALMPLYILLQKDINHWINKIEHFINEEKLQYYAEDAFNLVSHKLKLYPYYLSTEYCMEIDDEDDLAMANSLLSTHEPNTHL